MTHDELERAAGRLQMSPTLQRLAELAKGMPCDMNNPNDLKTVLATCSMDLIAALDNGRIEFKHQDDKSIFYGLLTVCTDFVMNGGLSKAQPVEVSRH